MSHTSTQSASTLSTTAHDLIARAATVISVPKAAPPNSFVLHAPLEFIARVQLLSYMSPARHDDALAMIEWLADLYVAAGDPVAGPARDVGAPRPAALIEALAEGDQDLVDAMAAAWLPLMNPAEIVGAFGEAVVPSLAAAGHAPIGLALLLRADRSSPPLPTTLLRGPLRSLAAQPGWCVSWHVTDDVVVGGDGDASLLYDALRSAPRLGRPGSDFIFPLMSQAQQPGVADRILGPVLADRFDVPAALHTVTRVAAWSMLLDDPTQAPYGWSHALTMPQAVLGLAGSGVRPRTALAVASTYALGFRVASATVSLPPVIQTVARSRPAAVLVAELTAAASVHQDAHLVKYTLACVHAAADDPEFAGLYLAAAEHLAEWWRAQR